jgi:hypothetical protein
MDKKIFLLLGCCFFMATIAERSAPSSCTHTPASTTVRHADRLEVNQIGCPFRNDGIFAYCGFSDSKGFEYPIHSDKTVSYMAGLWVSGQVKSEVRTACAYWLSEYQPGCILPDGTAADPADASTRIYKISRGDNGAANPDYRDWPWSIGAPADPVTHMPIFYGDQQIWAVFNDLGSHDRVFQGKSLGLEVQMLAWAFDNPLLSRVIFIKFDIINKCQEKIEQAYIGFYLDPDNGYSSDDEAGCDTTLNLGYCYNGSEIDAVYGKEPPALGLVWLQGCQVKADGESAGLIDGRSLAGQRILGMTSFNVYY